MISNRRYWFLMVLLLLVYVAGMFVTLFENDSAQFAVMAMRMVQENDFINLFKGPQEYLDKPHMHYWLAALSFKIFGIHDWAYRIPAILATFLAAYSCYGLGKVLYTKNVGKLAALIFMSCQTIILSVIDVRTDAVLTAFTIFSLWHLADYAKNNHLKAIVLGAFGAGMAFSTKGQIALVVIGFPILCYIAYLRKWKVFLNWKVLVALVVFGLTIVPMLYAYYHQFDLHPEKIIRGKSDRSGIFFIFWEQSFERMSGEGMGKNSSDYFFFFHTFLWVFLPWTFIGILGYYTRLKNEIKAKFWKKPNLELLTLGGITLIFFTISFAQFKLPHYLNICMPLFAVLSAAYLVDLYVNKEKTVLKWLLGLQHFILAVVFIAATLCCFYVFELKHNMAYVLMFIATLIIVRYSLTREHDYFRIVTISVCTAVLLNSTMNLHFYPNLLKYQAGSSMAQTIKKNNIDVNNIYKISSAHTWGLDFYNKKPVKIIDVSALKGKHNIWVYGSDQDLKALESKGYKWHQKYSEDQFRITRLQAKFLNPSTRKKVLNKMHLVQLN